MMPIFSRLFPVPAEPRRYDTRGPIDLPEGSLGKRGREGGREG